MKKNKFIVDMKAIDLELLKEDIETMKAYLLLKFREQDWHAVSDAANDLREMEIKRSWCKAG
jgi:hypothetical protein